MNMRPKGIVVGAGIGNEIGYLDLVVGRSTVRIEIPVDRFRRTILPQLAPGTVQGIFFGG